MRRTHSEETEAEARRLCETTGMTYVEIGAALGGVSGPTVAAWKRRGGWTRSPLAIHRRPIPREKRDAAAVLRRAGAAHGEIAVLLDCHPETARRIGREGHGGAAGPPLGAIAPEIFAALNQAVASGGAGRRELVSLAERAFVLAAAELLADRGLPPDRRARGMALVVASIRALPDGSGPISGDPSHDDDTGPASFDEINDLLAELALRFGEDCAGGQGHAGHRDPLAPDGAASP